MICPTDATIPNTSWSHEPNSSPNIRINGNRWHHNNLLCGWFWGTEGRYGDPSRISEVAQPSNVVELVEFSRWEDYMHVLWYFNKPSYTLRHLRGSNFSFVDGHVEWIPHDTMPINTTDTTGATWTQDWPEQNISFRANYPDPYDP